MTDAAADDRDYGGGITERDCTSGNYRQASNSGQERATRQPHAGLSPRLGAVARW
jgi:hypothetical protein